MNISVIVATYNRSHLLDQALTTLLNQDAPGLEYEVIVVDNNSSDSTAAKILSYAARDHRIRYIFEPRQGVAYARNSGIEAAKADLLAFCDDDVYVAPDWLQKLYAALRDYPEAAFIGGKIHPVWKQAPPKWLSSKSQPLALQDRGDEPGQVSIENRICLVSASLGVRRSTFERAGLFDPATQRVKDGIGSTEDYDWEMKVWEAGLHGMYVPNVVCYCEVPAERMKKSYHRRWYLGFGKFNALARRKEFNSNRRLFDVPLFLYRQVLQGLVSVPLTLLAGNGKLAFEREGYLLFCLGFIGHRWKSQLGNTILGKKFIGSKTDAYGNLGRSINV